MQEWRLRPVDYCSNAVILTKRSFLCNFFLRILSLYSVACVWMYIYGVHTQFHIWRNERVSDNLFFFVCLLLLFRSLFLFFFTRSRFYSFSVSVLKIYSPDFRVLHSPKWYNLMRIFCKRYTLIMYFTFFYFSKTKCISTNKRTWTQLEHRCWSAELL